MAVSPDKTPEGILEELHAGIGCLLQLSRCPIMRHEEIGFIARALDDAVERLRKTLDKKQRAPDAA